MNNYYTKLRNIQMIISLLKQHNIRKVIASPGTTHFQFLGSIQNDPYFEIYFINGRFIKSQIMARAIEEDADVYTLDDWLGDFHQSIGEVIVF